MRHGWVEVVAVSVCGEVWEQLWETSPAPSDAEVRGQVERRGHRGAEKHDCHACLWMHFRHKFWKS